MSLHSYLKCQISYVLQVTHYRYPMALVWVESWLIIWIFRLKLRIMGISLRYILWFIIIFYSSMMVYYQFSDCRIDFFSLVACSIIGQVLILFKMIYVEGLHSPIWAIRIVVFLLYMFVWGLCDYNLLKNNFLSAELFSNLGKFKWLKCSLIPHIKQPQK